MRYRTFLRWLTRFAELLNVPRRQVCLDAAYWYYRRGYDPIGTFKRWAHVAERR